MHAGCANKHPNPTAASLSSQDGVLAYICEIAPHFPVEAPLEYSKKVGLVNFITPCYAVESTDERNTKLRTTTRLWVF